MAFCIRSERKMDYYKKDVINPGPGEYFQEKETKKIKNRIHPPFHTSGKRSSIIKQEEIPGPGSYDLIDKSLYNNDASFNINNNNNNKKEEINLLINNDHKTNNNNNNSSIQKNNKSSFFCNTINNNSISNLVEASTNPIFSNKKGFSDYENSSNTSKIGFLSQAIRFNDRENNSKINEPGPGSYETMDHTAEIILNNNKKKQKNESKLMKASLKVEVGSLNRIVSIPSKAMNGYNIEKKNKASNDNCFSDTLGEYKLIIDRITKFGKNMSTSEYVGPGSYDVHFIEKGNSVLNWSKGFNLKELKNKQELMKIQQFFDEMKRYGDTINKENRNKKINIINLCKSNSAHFMVGKYKKGLNDLNKKVLENNVNKKKSKTLYYTRDSFIQDKKEIPGPGYYSKELINKDKDTLYYKDKEKEKIEQQKKINKKLAKSNFRRVIFGEEMKTEIKFGSNCGRFLNKSKSMENLGPTTYFKQKNKYEPNKKPDIFNHLKTGKLVYSFESRDFLKNNKKPNEKVENIVKQKENIEKQEKSMSNTNNNSFLNKTLRDNPGPGEYEISHNFIIPSFGQISLMNSSVERFPNIKQKTPGPGSYINKDNTENQKMQEKIKKIINFGSQQQHEEKMRRIEEIKKLNRIKKEFPGVGNYNPGLQETINYKAKSKINPKQSYQSPFLISSERFRYTKDERISPAVYDPYKYDNNNHNLQYMVFGKAQRFVSNCNDENMKGVWHMAGPGSYDTKDYWNKKTYNKLFSQKKQ